MSFEYLLLCFQHNLFSCKLYNLIFNNYCVSQSVHKNSRNFTDWFLHARKNQLQHTTEQGIHIHLPGLPKYHKNYIKEARKKKSMEQHCGKNRKLSMN